MKDYAGMAGIQERGPSEEQQWRNCVINDLRDIRDASLDRDKALLAFSFLISLVNLALLVAIYAEVFKL